MWTASYDRTIIVTDARTSARRARLEGHADCITALAHDVVHNVVYSAALDGTIIKWCASAFVELARHDAGTQVYTLVFTQEPNDIHPTDVMSFQDNAGVNRTAARSSTGPSGANTEDAVSARSNNDTIFCNSESSSEADLYANSPGVDIANGEALCAEHSVDSSTNAEHSYTDTEQDEEDPITDKEQTSADKEDSITGKEQTDTNKGDTGTSNIDSSTKNASANKEGSGNNTGDCCPITKSNQPGDGVLWAGAHGQAVILRASDLTILDRISLSQKCSVAPTESKWRGCVQRETIYFSQSTMEFCVSHFAMCLG